MVDPQHKAIMEAKVYRGFCEGATYDVGQVHIDGPVNVGRFSEISGPGTYLGRYVRVGFGCFICAGTVLNDYVFLGPRVTFCHDPKGFPSGGKGWKRTIVERGARIGAGAIILGGVTIGENAVIGAGAVVTKDVPAGEVWAGNPAKVLERRVL